MRINSLPIDRSRTALIKTEYFAAIGFALLFIFKKLPFILYDGEVNPDESQMLTQAITLAFDPVFWRSVDGTTAGPINSYLLLIVSYFGFPFNYSLLHSTSVALILVSLFITYLTIRQFYSSKVSWLSILIIYGFFFVTNHKDFNHYNSELPSVFLITIAIFLLAKIVRANKKSLWLLIAFGAVCCLIPFAKLQGGPFGFLYILTACLVVYKSKNSTSDKLWSIFYIALGGIFVLGGIVMLLYLNGVLYDFYLMYIKTNLSHYNPGDGLKLFVQLVFKSSYDYLFFLLFCVSMWGLAALIAIRDRHYSFFYNEKLWFLVIQVVLSFYVIAKTGYIFEHYLFYTFFPLVLLTAYAIHLILEHGLFKKAPQLSFALIAIALVSGFGLTFYLERGKVNQNFIGSKPSSLEGKTVGLINRYSNPTDCLVVWGWNLKYHTLTGLRQGTRENHSIRCMKTNALGVIHDPELNTYYQEQYVADMKKNKPAVFIDEVRANSFFDHPEEVIHQTVPGLGELVANDYRLVSDESGILVYVRKDRL